MKFKFFEGDDIAKYVITENGKDKTQTDSFKFRGFSNTIHPFFKKQIDFAVKALKSKGIILNVINVPTIQHMGKDADKGYFENEDIKIFSNLQKSEDGNFYCLLQDKEMGRGWSILYKVYDGKVEIISQEHRSNVRDEIMKGEFIRSFGVDYLQSYNSKMEI
jgi:hypothetical protein